MITTSPFLLGYGSPVVAGEEEPVEASCHVLVRNKKKRDITISKRKGDITTRVIGNLICATELAQLPWKLH